MAEANVSKPPRRGPGRPTGPTQPRVEQIEAAAAALFRRQSYHGTTMRDIADVVGMDVSSLYNHFDSKQSLLNHLILRGNQQLLLSVQNAVERAGEHPHEKLHAAVHGFIAYHDGNLDVASIADTEIRGLEEEQVERINSLKSELMEVFRSIVRDGTEQGCFEPRDVSLETVFMLSVLVRINAWYQPSGSASLPKIADLMAEFLTRAISSSRCSCGGPGDGPDRPDVSASASGAPDAYEQDAGRA